MTIKVLQKVNFFPLIYENSFPQIAQIYENSLPQISQICAEVPPGLINETSILRLREALSVVRAPRVGGE